MEVNDIMKAIVQTGPQSIEIQERKRPSPGATEALVRVHSAGLCGSDVHAYLYDEGYEWVGIPRIMGHEYSGRVIEVGEQVTSFEPGDPVVEEPVHSCGNCFQCNNGQSNVCQNFSVTGMHEDGAYAETVVVNERHLHPVPEEVPLDTAAITEPTSVAARAVLGRSNILPGDSILVQGPGPIGVLVALIADSIGANVLVSGVAQDTIYRLPLVEDLGIDTINVQTTPLAEASMEFTDGTGFDIVFDATGHHSGIEMGVDQVRKGGQLVVVGIPGTASTVSMAPLVRGEIDVTTSYGSVWRDFEKALQLMEQGSIRSKQILDTSFDWDSPEDAFEAFLQSETCKPIFSFTTE